MKEKLEKDEVPFFHDKIEGKHGFTVPDGYFESLPDLLVERLRDELDIMPKKTKVVSLWSHTGLLRWAAVVALLVVIGGFYLLQKTSPASIAFANNETIVEYLLSDEVTLDEDDLAILPISDVDIELDIPEESIDALLEDVNDGELEGILQETL